VYRPKKLYNFNISIVVRDRDFLQDRDRVYEVLEMASHAAWEGGDPGVIFLDRILEELPYNQEAVSEHLGEIGTLVPCGEQAMHPNEVCTLGAINLAAESLWKNDRLNPEVFRNTVDVGIRALDSAQKKMDLLGDGELERVAKLSRRLGLGLMGWSDALAVSPKREENKDALIGQIGTIFKQSAHSTSSAILKEETTGGLGREYGRAHLTLTCVPPTGGITLVAGNKGFALDLLPEDAEKQTYREQLGELSKWQSYFDNTISKTVAVPNSGTPHEVFGIFLTALEMGLKTITVYRSGSKVGQPLETSSELRGPVCVDC